jgi:hypothetical protein
MCFTEADNDNLQIRTHSTRGRCNIISKITQCLNDNKVQNDLIMIMRENRRKRQNK